MSETRQRKAEHITVCIENPVQARLMSTGFDDVCLVHKMLPEISLEEIDTSINLFGHRLSAPIVIEAMTGGTEEAAKINRVLAEAAEEYGVALGVGSQRAALEDDNLTYTFRIARDKAPHAFLIGNLGAPQIVGGDYLENVRRAVEIIDADAFAIHLNSLQEALQPEGEPSFKGLTEKIKEIVRGTQVPIIAKETGAGVACEEAKLLEGLGIKGIDVAGAGGTSWAAVESYRAKMRMDVAREKLGNTFWDWGIPTAVSTVEVSQTTRLMIISSGGVRTGVDAAKALALGGNAVGLALPFLRPAIEGKVGDFLETLIGELRTAMFLTGARTVEELRRMPIVIMGKTAEWLRARGFKPESYATRRMFP